MRLMTREEAIDILKYMKLNYSNEADAIYMAIDALEKQIPKKPISEKIMDDTVYSCPVCDEVVHDLYDKFCPSCGQRLDWGDGK